MLIRRLGVIAVVVVTGLAGMSALAGAHAKLARAEPVPESTVHQPPKVVRLWFSLGANEELDTKRSTLSVWDSRDRRVDDGRGGVDLNDLDRRSMIATLKPIGPGSYAVRWKAVSSPDLSEASGTFKFTVASEMGTAPLPPLALISPADGTTVRNPVVVVFETPADLSKMTTGSHAHGDKAGMPHLHIDVNLRVTMPALKHLTKIGEHRYRFEVGKLPAGRHVIRLYWADAKQHKPIGPTQQITITVAP